jgi:hypothetical protein
VIGQGPSVWDRSRPVIIRGGRFRHFGLREFEGPRNVAGLGSQSKPQKASGRIGVRIFSVFRQPGFRKTEDREEFLHHDSPDRKKLSKRSDIKRVVTRRGHMDGG